MSSDLDEITEKFGNIIRRESSKMVGQVTSQELIQKVSETTQKVLTDFCKSQIKFELTVNGDMLNVTPKNNFTADLMREVKDVG